MDREVYNRRRGLDMNLDITGREDYRSDYHDFLDEVGMTEDQVIRIVESEEDIIDDPIAGVNVQGSVIHGQGLFASQPFRTGDIIGKARIGDYRTQIGRYTNHDPDPNAFIDMDGDDVSMFALRPILEGDEITTSYRDTYERLSFQPTAQGKDHGS